MPPVGSYYTDISQCTVNKTLEMVHHHPEYLNLYLSLFIYTFTTKYLLLVYAPKAAMLRVCSFPTHNIQVFFAIL